MYILEREQLLKADLKNAWDFLKNPNNLNYITPSDLNFKIISSVPKVMFEGLIIEYQITIPRIGRQRWIAEIKHIRENHSFVDEQRVGPFRFWYHYHQITADDAGVKSIDKVHYIPPYGFLGNILDSVFIQSNLKRIFDYRMTKLNEHFSGKKYQNQAR